jgi:hypothetical protein
MATAVNYTKGFSTTLFEALSPKGSAVKDVLKSVSYASKWAQIVDPNLSPSYVAIGDLGGNAKNFLSGLEAVENSSKLYQSTKALFTQYDAAGADKRYDMRFTVIKNVCDLSNNVGDFTKLLSRFFQIPHMKHVEGGCGAFTLAGAVNNLWNDVSKLSNLKETETKFNHQVHYVINVISDLCYMLVGALVVSVWLGFITVPPVAILLPLTVALVCSLTNFFFKNLTDLSGEAAAKKKAFDALEYQTTHKCLPGNSPNPALQPV